MVHRHLIVSALAVLIFIIGGADDLDLSTGKSLSYSLLQAKARIDSAVTHADKQLLIETKKRIEELVPQKHDTKVLANYYAAYADYRLSSIFEDIKEEQKNKYLDASIKKLEQVTDIAPDFAEGWALLGNCYGMKATGMISGMRYGPKSERAIDKALKLAPKNPRVTMIHGISLMYKPGMFGGSVEKAIQEFQKASDYFKEWNSQNKLHPEWGKAENYAWLAQAYIKQDKLPQAKDAYQASLHIDPDYYWVKDVLLPELEDKM